MGGKGESHKGKSRTDESDGGGKGSGDADPTEGHPQPPGPPAPAVPPAAPGAVTTGQPPGIVPPTLPSVPAGTAGPSAGPGPATVPAPQVEKGQLGPLLPRTDYGVDVPCRTCFLSFTKLRRILRWHFVLLTLAVYSSPQVEQIIDRIGVDTLNIYIVSLALRARHALLASMLQNINRLRSAAYQQLDNSVRSRLNAYNDVLVDPIIARII